MKFQSITDSIVDHLRVQIITGALPAGGRLNENEMSDKFGISRPPLREAFRRLEHENILTSIPRKGTYVSDMSIRDCEDIHQVRGMIEISAVNILKDKKIRRLPLVEKALEMAQNHTAPQTWDSMGMLEYFRVMAAFHNQLVESCQNSWLIHVYRSLGSNLTRYQVMYLQLPGSHEASMKEHGMILELIREGRHQGAAKLLGRHIDGILEQLKRKMSAAESKYADPTEVPEKTRRQK